MRTLFSRLLAAGSLALSALPVAAQPAEAAPPTYVVRMLGSGMVADLMGPIIVDFLKSEGWTDVAQKPAKEGGAFYVLGRAPGETKISAVYLEPSDPETGIAALGQGFADIAMSSRRATEAEVTKLASVGNLHAPECEYPIASDGVAVIVHSSNPINSLTLGQLKAVFARRTTAWEELGATGAIHPYVRDEKSGTNLTFQAAAMGKDSISPDAMKFATHREIAKAVTEDPRGIGLVALPYAGPNKVLGIASTDAAAKPVRPTLAEVQAGTYPLSRKLYLYTAAAPSNPLIAKLAKFAVSPAGEGLALKAGYGSPKAPVQATPPPAVTAAPTPVPEAIAPTPTPRPRPTPRPARDRDDDEPRRVAPTPRPTAVPTPVPVTPTPTRRPSRFVN